MLEQKNKVEDEKEFVVGTLEHGGYKEDKDEDEGFNEDKEQDKRFNEDKDQDEGSNGDKDKDERSNEDKVEYDDYEGSDEDEVEAGKAKEESPPNKLSEKSSQEKVSGEISLGNINTNETYRIASNGEAWCKVSERRLISPSGIQGTCYDPQNPCARCVCKKGKPGFPPQLSRDENGCKKAKLCPHYCPSWREKDHRVGDEWKCWHDDHK